MASQCYLVHHHIKPNMSDAWWAKVGGQTEEDSKHMEVDESEAVKNLQAFENLLRLSVTS